MVVLALLLAASSQTEAPIVRDAYGVPHIKAASIEQAFYQAGYAVAQDRLWQMEASRRLARGKMAEVFGKSFAASDEDILKTFYTDEELQAQLDSLSAKTKSAYVEYARGINAWIGEAKGAGKLPTGYSDAGFQPEPWTPIDSVAITVRLFQQFGQGGAGEIRNMALLGYLQNQPNTKARYLDVLDDFAWQNDPAATTTVSKGDDPLASNPAKFPALTRQITQQHIGALPKVGILELLPGIRLASNETSKLVAEQVNVPYKMGSYAIVVGKGRSSTGSPILLNGPQMGFRTPSIVHEMSLDAPGLSLVGADVPGVPGIIVGHTKTFAWGLTSGVADTDDIFFSKTSGSDGYTYGNATEKIQTISRTLKIKGENDKTVVQQRTRFGPIVVSSKSSGVVFSRRSSYRMREMLAADAMFGLYNATSADDLEKSIERAPMSFNFFYATNSGDIGWHYIGDVPMRADGLDPRFPTPGEPRYEWKGMVPKAQMPRVRNPKNGLIVNWNNKPVAWWPNFDTPVWGRLFRNSAILAQLQVTKISVPDVEHAAWAIARIDFTAPFFNPYLQKGVQEEMQRRYIRDPGPITGFTQAAVGFDGWTFDGLTSPTAYNAFLDALKEEVFIPTTGNFLTADNFRLVAQPSVLLRALERKTNVDYLGKRSVDEVVGAAMQKAATRLATARGNDWTQWTYKAPSIPVPGQAPIPYSDRGTFIQIVELRNIVFGRNILSPGVAETGPNSLDQVPLARAWTYKPMTGR